MNVRTFVARFVQTFQPIYLIPLFRQICGKKTSAKRSGPFSMQKVEKLLGAIPQTPLGDSTPYCSTPAPWSQRWFVESRWETSMQSGFFGHLTARKPPFVLAWCFLYWWKDQRLPKIGQVWLVLQRFVCFELRPTIVASLDWGCLGTTSKSWCLLRTYRSQPHLSVLPSNIDSCSHRLRCNSVNAIWTICLNCPLRTEWSRFRGVEMWFFQKPCYLGRLVLVIKWFPVFPFHQIDVGWQQQRKEVI